MTLFYKEGDHLVTGLASGITHHGLGLSNRRVIEYDGQVIRIVSLYEFCHRDSHAAFSVFNMSSGSGGSNGEAWIHDHPSRKYSRAESVERAMTRLGETKYGPVSNNCEHFVNWCIEGHHFSHQAYTVKRGAGSVSGAAVAGYTATATVGLAGVTGTSGAAAWLAVWAYSLLVAGRPAWS